MKRSREPEDPPTPSTLGAHDSDSEDFEETLLPTAKVIEIEALAEDEKGVAMKCFLPPHKEPQSFRTYAEYETHYRSTHTNRCVECGKNFPSAHLLDVHIEECHDSFAAVKRERGEQTFSCFVEGCERKCSTPQKRRMHLIDKHLYPRNFFFAVTKEGIDGRRSLLLERGHRHRRSSTITVDSSLNPNSHGANAATTDQQADPEVLQQATAREARNKDDSQDAPDVDMDDLAGAMSSLRFVPTSIRFGRGGRNAGFAKR